MQRKQKKNKIDITENSVDYISKTLKTIKGIYDKMETKPALQDPDDIMKMFDKKGVKGSKKKLNFELTATDLRRTYEAVNLQRNAYLSQNKTDEALDLYEIEKEIIDQLMMTQNQETKQLMQLLNQTQ